MRMLACLLALCANEKCKRWQPPPQLLPQGDMFAHTPALTCKRCEQQCSQGESGAYRRSADELQDAKDRNPYLVQVAVIVDVARHSLHGPRQVGHLWHSTERNGALSSYDTAKRNAPSRVLGEQHNQPQRDQ